MPAKLRLAIAQINPCVGDFAGNVAQIREGFERARRAGSNLVLFPEMAVTGYPPEDLLFRKDFLDRCAREIQGLARHCKGLTAVIGAVDSGPKRPFNAAFVLRDGRVLGRYRKMCLPNYGVFDEARYFEPGREPLIFSCAGRRIAVSICEDIWVRGGPFYDVLKPGDADLLVNLSASPYERGKQPKREAVVRYAAKRLRMPVIYVNLVGGQDELIFDGQSFIADAQGGIVARAKGLEEDLLVAAWPPTKKRGVRVKAARASGSPEEVYKALVLGTRDYVEKNRFPKALIGLSGGIDSALVACLAVDALGPERVVGVTMPSPFTSSETLEDARRLAARLRIELAEFPIRSIMDSYEAVLHPAFQGTASGTAEENIQARVRGNLLMALSNKFGWLVLTTGNKSEIATGYCTLYGDMAGGFAVIKDVPKTLVYRLAVYRNRRGGGPPIPDSTIRRAPSAELRPNQTDQDTLPPYASLDRFIERYVDGDAPLSRAAVGLPKGVLKAAIMIDRNEYKRRQAPPGIKITSKAFGRDRRMPITNRFISTGS